MSISEFARAAGSRSTAARSVSVHSDPSATRERRTDRQRSRDPLQGYPTNLIEMKSLLRDFTEAHRPALQGIIQSKISIFGGADKFLQANGSQFCLVPLKYGPPGPDGFVNSALTFTYTNMVFLPLDRVLNSIEEKRSTRCCVKARRHPRGIYVKFIELGVVMRSPREDKARVSGFMRSLGKKWEWRPLFKNDWYTNLEWTLVRNKKERVQLLKRKMAAEGQLA
ncbi:hypothetical protein C8Q74DRAFT_1213144 [Fomes fomentarius]|nr:hypothetical protein C8Q74DRAFT_1213144 [Fomes fomentarius]